MNTRVSPESFLALCSRRRVAPSQLKPQSLEPEDQCCLQNGSFTSFTTHGRRAGKPIVQSVLSCKKCVLRLHQEVLFLQKPSLQEEDKRHLRKAARESVLALLYRLFMYRAAQNLCRMSFRSLDDPEVV